MNNYHINDQLGRGKYSVVYKGRKKKTLDYVAVKKLVLSRQKKILNQLKHLQHLDHPNIIKFHQMIKSKNHYWMIMEYCPGGDLQKMIKQDKSYPESTIKTFLKDIVLGLQYIHSKGIIFSDLKPQNIMVNEYGTLKLANFGAARTINDIIKNQDIAAKKGTPVYMAPELFFQQKPMHSFSSDFWALGCLMYELAIGMSPFASLNASQIITLSIKSETPKVDGMSLDFNDLLSRLLEKQPGKRIQWRQLRRHKWWVSQIPNLQIPKQPHFQQYIKSFTFSKQKQILNSDKLNYNINKNQNGQESLNYKLQKKKDGRSNRREGINNAQSDQEMTQENINVGESLNIGLDDIVGLQLVPIQKIMKHVSDTAVKPIIGNKQIQKTQTYHYSKELLPFYYIPPVQVINAIGSPQIQTHLKQIFSSLQSKSDQKMHILNYFQQCIQSQISNTVIKKDYYINILLKLVKNAKAVPLKVKVCQVLGLLIRHATVIEPEFAKKGLTAAMLDLLKQKSQKLKRKAIACLGQYLFYAATQLDQQEANEIWDLPQVCYAAIIRQMKTNEDQIVIFYTVKTIQNITAQAIKVGKKFANHQVVNCLIKIYQNFKNQLLKLSCLMCIHHIVALNITMLDAAIQKLNMKHITTVLVSLDSNNKVIQMILCLLNSSLNSKTKISKQIIQDKQLISSVFNLIQNQSNAVKTKVLIFIWFILKVNVKNWVLLVSTKIFQYLQKLKKQNKMSVLQALHHLIICFQQSIPQIFEQLQQQLSKLYNSFNQANYEYERNKKSNRLMFLNVLICALNSQVLCGIFQKQKYVYQIFDFIQYCDLEIGSPTINSVTNNMMIIYEGILNKSKIVFTYQDYFVGKLIPKVMQKMKSTKHSQMRFNYLKIFSYLIGHFYGQEYLYSSSKQQNTIKFIQDIIINKFYACLNSLLKDQQPVPTYCLKLIGIMIDKQPNYIIALKKYNLIAQITDSYQVGHKLNHNTLNIIVRLVKSNLLQKQQIIQLNIIQKTIDILTHYSSHNHDVLLQSPLITLQSLFKVFLDLPKLFYQQPPPIDQEIQKILKIKKSKLEDLMKSLLKIQNHIDEIVMLNVTQIVAILMFYGIFVNQNHQIRQKRGCYNLLYQVRHGSGKISKSNQKVLNQLKIKQ